MPICLIHRVFTCLVGGLLWAPWFARRSDFKFSSLMAFSNDHFADHSTYSATFLNPGRFSFMRAFACSVSQTKPTVNDSQPSQFPWQIPLSSAPATCLGLPILTSAPPPLQLLKPSMLLAYFSVLPIDSKDHPRICQWGQVYCDRNSGKKVVQWLRK